MDADAIVKRADQHLRGNTSYAEYTMTLIRPTWSREMTLRTWSKGDDEALILVTSPSRDRGTTFLKLGHEVWNWIPSVERVIKIPPSMMSQAWMGSDFTNDDLVKEASIVTDYSHSVVGDTTIADRACWKIRMIPHPDAAVVWGKVDLYVDKKDDLELLARYFDEDGSLVNEMQMSAIKTLGERVIPTVLTVIPKDKPGHRTVLTYADAWWNQTLDDSFFSQQNMKRVH